MYVFLGSSCRPPPLPSRRPLSSSEGEEGRSCLEWQQYAVGGVVGVPHCGSRGFGSEDKSGGENEAGNTEYICM